jgi:hypothetical protein
MGQHLGLPVSQNAAGDLLGHVRDTGRSIADPSVRGYQTRIRLAYHTDGSDVVGLLCFRPAKSGGLSSIVSSTTVYNEVLRRRPDLIELMYEPFYYDRREEQGPGEDPWYTSAIACYLGGKLSVRYIRGFIESAQRFAELPRLTVQQRELLDVIDAVANDPDVELRMDFEPGDMQFEQLLDPPLPHRLRGLRRARAEAPPPPAVAHHARGSCPRSRLRPGHGHRSTSTAAAAASRQYDQVGRGACSRARS